ncbi:hypothetical protein BCR44DRAFT_1495115 [Catenaria anguillulae PL171]|uniref:Uncharacterized protein n=1 Tax=Catenaria anguillulae PL171 TaxID=765915 RepID=A0A1Y2I5U7_9FUNG|nr:hypothetical protein BCR44DRAFT_1495115 [Catenaria anguillulae PL171]
MPCHRIRSASPLMAVAAGILAVLAVVTILAPTMTAAQSDLCSSQRTRDSCESQSPTSPTGSQCYWSGLACHLADACGSDCSKPGCQRCATFPDLCYPLTLRARWRRKQVFGGWARQQWDSECTGTGDNGRAANGAVQPGQTTSGGTPIGLILGIIALVAVVGVVGMVLVTRHRRQGRKSAAGSSRAGAGTPSVPLSSNDSPQPPPSAGRASSSFAKPSTTYNGTRQILSPSTQPLSASSSVPSTPATSVTAVNAAAPATLDTSRPAASTSKSATVTSPITSPGSTPIPRPAAAWPATGMSPMHQRSSPPNMSRDSVYTDLSTTVTEHPMSMDYVVPEKSRMTMISIADTDRELGSEVGTPMDEEFGARRRSSYFATSSPPNGTPTSGGGAPVGMRMLPSSASVATSEFSAVTDSGSLGPIALPPAPSSRVNSMAGSSALGSMVPATPVSAVPSRMHMPDTPGSPGSPYSLADIEYYSQVGSSGNVAPAPAASGSPTASERAMRR